MRSLSWCICDSVFLGHINCFFSPYRECIRNYYISVLHLYDITYHYVIFNFFSIFLFSVSLAGGKEGAHRSVSILMGNLPLSPTPFTSTPTFCCWWKTLFTIFMTGTVDMDYNFIDRLMHWGLWFIDFPWGRYPFAMLCTWHSRVTLTLLCRTVLQLDRYLDMYAFARYLGTWQNPYLTSSWYLNALAVPDVNR